MLIELVKKNRSYRRFFENELISRETLLRLIELARLSPSGANRQPLKYYVSCEKEQNEKIFPSLAWAGYLKDWQGPEEGERPTGYIVIVQEENYKMTNAADTGIAAQTILLGAVEAGLGGCMIASIQKATLRAALNIPETQDILLVLALGKPKETVVIDTMTPDGDVKYWRDENQVHHVPKRNLSEIILN